MGLSADEIAKIVAAAIKQAQDGEKKNATVPFPEPEKVYQELSVFDMPTDEEILYYATPYYDELVSKKESKKQAIEDEKALREEEHA